MGLRFPLFTFYVLRDALPVWFSPNYELPITRIFSARDRFRVFPFLRFTFYAYRHFICPSYVLRLKRDGHLVFPASRLTDFGVIDALISPPLRGGD